MHWAASVGEGGPGFWVFFVVCFLWFFLFSFLFFSFERELGKGNICGRKKKLLICGRSKGPGLFNWMSPLQRCPLGDRVWFLTLWGAQGRPGNEGQSQSGIAPHASPGGAPLCQHRGGLQWERTGGQGWSWLGFGGVGGRKGPLAPLGSRQGSGGLLGRASSSRADSASNYRGRRKRICCHTYCKIPGKMKQDLIGPR